MMIKACVLASGSNQREARESVDNGLLELHKVKDAKAIQAVNDVCQASLFRVGLSESMVTLESNSYFKRYVQVLNSLNVDLKSEALTEIVHNISLAVNDF